MGVHIDAMLDARDFRQHFSSYSPSFRPSIPVPSLPLLREPKYRRQSPPMPSCASTDLPSDIPKTIFPIPFTISLLSLSTIDLGTNSVAVGLIGGIVWRFPGGKRVEKGSIVGAKR